MDYIELNIRIKAVDQAEILIAELADFPFESFLQEDDHLKAYIPCDFLPGCRHEVDTLLSHYGISDSRYLPIPAQNWNARWESDFTPVDVDGKLYIRAPFHAPAPAGVAEVIIQPKMSFGSGHHATTCLMITALLDLSIKAKQGLDMGSGTGVLSIVAVQQGAAHMDAVDVDEWADDNCRENIVANGMRDRITPILGDAHCLVGRSYDFILANINRNILTRDMSIYVKALRSGGTLLLSGFLEQDIPLMEETIRQFGLTPVDRRVREGWALVRGEK
ncbi:MAG: 50S ribosomal protein L11 methyltransferase [Alistipes sp.]